MERDLSPTVGSGGTQDQWSGGESSCGKRGVTSSCLPLRGHRAGGQEGHKVPLLPWEGEEVTHPSPRVTSMGVSAK